MPVVPEYPPPPQASTPKVILTQDTLAEEIELAKMECMGGYFEIVLDVKAQVKPGSDVDYVFKNEQGRWQRKIREIERLSGGTVIFTPAYRQTSDGQLPVYEIAVTMGRLSQAFQLLEKLKYNYSLKVANVPKSGSWRRDEPPWGAQVSGLFETLENGNIILKKTMAASISCEFNVKKQKEYRSGEIGDRWDFLALRQTIWHETMELALLALCQEILGTLNAILSKSHMNNEVDLALDRFDIPLVQAFLYWPGDPPFDSFEARALRLIKDADQAERMTMAREQMMTHQEALDAWFEVYDLWVEAQSAVDEIPAVYQRIRLTNMITARLSRISEIVDQLHAGQRPIQTGSTSSKMPRWEIKNKDTKGEFLIIRYWDWPEKFTAKIIDATNRVFKIQDYYSSGIYVWRPQTKLNPGMHRVRISFDEFSDNERELVKQVSPQEDTFNIPAPDFSIEPEDLCQVVMANITYSGFYHGFEAEVFDSKGNKLSSPHSPIEGQAPAGKIVWDTKAKQDTYTIKAKGGPTKKVELYSRVDPSWEIRGGSPFSADTKNKYMFCFWDWKQLDPFHLQVFDPSGIKVRDFTTQEQRGCFDLVPNFPRVPFDWQGGEYTVKVLTTHPRVVKTAKLRIYCDWQLRDTSGNLLSGNSVQTEKIIIHYTNWPERFKAEILNYKKERVITVSGRARIWEDHLPWGQDAEPGTYHIKPVNMPRGPSRTVIITKKLEWSACVKFGTSGPYIWITPKQGTKWPKGKGFGFSIHPEGSTSSIGYVTVSDSNQTGEVTWGKESGQKFPKWGRYTIWAYAKDPGLQAMFSNRSLCPNWRTDVEIPEPGFKVNGCKASVGVAASGPWIAPDKEQSLSIEYDNWPGKFKAKIRKRSSTQELVKLEGTSATRGSFTKKVTLPTRAYWIEARPYEGYIPLAIELTAVNP